MRLDKYFKMAKLLSVATAILLFAACSIQKPHGMQHLIGRNYLASIGLTKPVRILDLKQNENIRKIHIGTPGDTIVKNFMLFNQAGDLLSVREETGYQTIIELLHFSYDKHGRMSAIVPNKSYLPAVNHDSIVIEYGSGKPVKAKAIKRGKADKVTKISFDDQSGEYAFSSKARNNKDDLFDLYKFDGHRMISEHHRSREQDKDIDSTRYYYKHNVLNKSISIYSKNTATYTQYDDLGRPTESTTMFVKKDSVAWTEKYSYVLDDKLPYQIRTVSPLGWREVIKYFWEK